MNRMTAFASRNAKEMLRDPLNLAFGIGFPVGVMLLLTAIQSNIPVNMFTIDRLAPGMAVFGLSFVSLFSGQLISKDRGESFLMRLFASPLKSADYILGYTLPVLPMATAQSAMCFLVAYALGLKPSVNHLAALAVLIPASVLFIAIGLLAGSVMNDKQVGGICGALLTNVSAWLSGIWFDVAMVGGAFEKVANALPFIHAVNAARFAAAGEYAEIMPDLWWVIGYAVAITALAVIIFKKKMTGDNA